MLLLIEEGESRLTVRRARWWDRLSVRLHASQLDRELVAGASPDADPRLALRAQRLVRTSFRRELADSVHRIVEASTPPVVSRLSSIPLCRDRVTEASDELHALADRLCSPGPVSARGVARVSTLLGDGSGPLYHRGNTDDLRTSVHETVTALDPLDVG